MSKKYLLPVLLFLGFGFILLFLPSNKPHELITPEELLSQVNNPSRFISPDMVASRIIEKDPSILLVDVRTSDEFLNYTLPGAINIPLSNISSESSMETLKQNGIDFIFFSNGTIVSDQAWILGKRLGLDNIFIMQGGINLWFDNFFMTPVPSELEGGSEFELYQFRLGVRQFFTGGEINATPASNPETIQVRQKSKKSAAEGGC